MEDIKHNQKLVNFKALSHPYFEKNWRWYFFAGLIYAIVIGLFIYFKQYLGAFAVIISVPVFYIYSKIPPKEIDCRISSEGIAINQQLVPFSQLKSFWFTDGGDYFVLHLEPNGRLKMPIRLYLDNQPIEPLRRVLLEYLPEVIRQEDIADKILRVFKI